MRPGRRHVSTEDRALELGEKLLVVLQRIARALERPAVTPSPTPEQMKTATDRLNAQSNNIEARMPPTPHDEGV